MKTPTGDQIDKLPKWAIAYINLVERERDYAIAELDKNRGPAESRISGGHDQPFYVRDDHALRFRLDSDRPNEEWIEVRLQNSDPRRPDFIDTLHIYASRFVAVRPRASNVVEVRVER